MGAAEEYKTKGRVQIPCGHSGGPSKKGINAKNELVRFWRLFLFSSFCLFAIFVLLKVLLFLFFQEKKKKKLFDKSEFDIQINYNQRKKALQGIDLTMLFI